MAFDECLNDFDCYPPVFVAKAIVCTENLIRVDEVKESPKLTG
jgi:hypothetical protein